MILNFIRRNNMTFYYVDDGGTKVLFKNMADALFFIYVDENRGRFNREDIQRIDVGNFKAGVYDGIIESSNIVGRGFKRGSK
tara:strand:+ start:3046 stop:3291 length:246 start_codon:yes stop_codon:yes gene_type:complete